MQNETTDVRRETPPGIRRLTAETALARVREGIGCLVERQICREVDPAPKPSFKPPLDVSLHLYVMAGESGERDAMNLLAEHAINELVGWDDSSEIPEAARLVLYQLDRFEEDERALAAMLVEIEAEGEWARFNAANMPSLRDAAIRSLRRLAGLLVQLYDAVNAHSTIDPGLLRSPLWKWNAGYDYDPNCRRWVEAVHDAAMDAPEPTRAAGQTANPPPRADSPAPVPVAPSPAAREGRPRAWRDARIEDLIGEDLADRVMSDETFRKLRRKAGLDTSKKGGQAQGVAFSPADVDAMIEELHAGRYKNVAAVLSRWQQWSSAARSQFEANPPI